MLIEATRLPWRSRTSIASHVGSCSRFSRSLRFTCAIPSSCSSSIAAAMTVLTGVISPGAVTCNTSSGCSEFRPALSTKYTSESCSATEQSASHTGSHSGFPGKRGSSSCTSSNTGSSEAGRRRVERSRTSSSWARPNGSMDIHTCCFVCFSSRSNGSSSCSVCTDSVIGPVGILSLSPNCLEACSGVACCSAVPAGCASSMCWSMAMRLSPSRAEQKRTTG